MVGRELDFDVGRSRVGGSEVEGSRVRDFIVWYLVGMGIFFGLVLGDGWGLGGLW